MSIAGAWWLAAATTLAVSFWLLSLIPTGPTNHSAEDWEVTATRIEGRLGAGEIVLINRAGMVHKAQALAGFPLVCDKGGKQSKLTRGRRDGLWVVGEKKLSKSLKKALKKLKKRGTIEFGEVHLHHGWNPPGRSGK